MLLALLLASMFVASVNVRLVGASGTIFIRADGSIDPPTAPIQRDGELYTLTGNIMSDTDGIVIERDDVILDGAGYSLQGSYMNSDRGISLSMRYNVTVRNIEIEWFYEGIWLFESSYSNISGNNIANNGDGVLLHNSSNNGISGNNIADSWTYGISSTGDFQDYSSNNIITGNNITGCNGVGIWFCYSTDSSTISGNNITANEGDGIWLYYSSQNNSINGNNIADNWNWGIELQCSPNNSINGNNVAGNGAGIILYLSSGSVIIDNTFVDDGLYVADSSHYVVEDNTVNSKPLVYLENKSDVNVDYAGQVILVNCTNIKVENLDLSNTFIGVQLVKTNSSSISGNNITANYAASIHLSYSYGNSISGNNITANEGDGIYLSNSSGNNISGNNIENITANNRYGIFLYYSSQNSIYHNSFANNFGQAYVTPPDYANAWDDGYPSGGNYWSDYTGVDQYTGLSQNETGSDGIGDTAYIIDSNNQDSYPLMKPYPWASHDVGITSVTASKTIVGQGYNVSISIMAFNYGNYTENINITVYANTTMIGEINNIELSSRSFTIVQYAWNTSGFAKGKYSIKAVADTVQGETDILDNSYTGDWILVTKVGDLGGGVPPAFFNCDGSVDGKDLALFLQCYTGTAPAEAMYLGDLGGGVPPQFYDCDGNVDGKDLSLFLQCYNGLGP